jgi:3-dehydroquinate synthase
MQVMNKMLNVALAERSYPIHIGVGILAQAELILPYIKQKKVVVVTNTTVAPLYLELLRSTLKKGEISILPVILPDGEQFKTWETLNLIFDAMLEGRCERGTTLIALGGGVIGDMGVCSRLLSTRNAFHSSSDNASVSGRLISWRQDSHQSSARQKYDWSLLPA